MTKIVKIEINTNDLQSILKVVCDDFKEYGMIDLGDDERIDVLMSAMNEKMAALLAAGVRVVQSPSDIGTAVAAAIASDAA